MISNPRKEDECCKNCLYSLRVEYLYGHKKDERWLCQRYPPVMTVCGGGEDIGSDFESTVIKPDDWCGEFIKAEEGQ